MALSARPASLSAAPGASAGRISSGGRGVASMADTPIEEIGSRADVQANTKFNFQGFSEWERQKPKAEAEPLNNTSAPFDTFSSIFLNLLDNEQIGKKDGAAASLEKPRHQNFIAKAIRAYEGTAVVINREAVALGSSLSLSL